MKRQVTSGWTIYWPVELNRYAVDGGAAEASLPGGRSVYLYFRVGTASRGAVDAVESRALWFAAVLGGERVLGFGTLAALATHLREEQR